MKGIKPAHLWGLTPYKVYKKMLEPRPRERTNDELRIMMLAHGLGSVVVAAALGMFNKPEKPKDSKDKGNCKNKEKQEKKKCGY